MKKILTYPLIDNNNFSFDECLVNERALELLFNDIRVPPIFTSRARARSQTRLFHECLEKLNFIIDEKQLSIRCD